MVRVINFPQKGGKKFSVDGKKFSIERKFGDKKFRVIDVDSSREEALQDAEDRRKLTGRPTRVVKLSRGKYAIFSR